MRSGFHCLCRLSFLFFPRPPTRRHSHTVLPVSDCVSIPFALRPQHGNPGPPLPVICVRLLMMSRMNSMLISTAHTPIQCLFAGNISPYSQGQEHRIFLHFCTRTTTNSNFVHELIVCYEQTSSHTLWLEAFPCKPCKPKSEESCIKAPCAVLTGIIQCCDALCLFPPSKVFLVSASSWCYNNKSQFFHVLHTQPSSRTFWLMGKSEVSEISSSLCVLLILLPNLSNTGTPFQAPISPILKPSLQPSRSFLFFSVAHQMEELYGTWH